MDRLLNYFFLFLLILTFIIGASASMQYAIVLGIPIAVGSGMLAFVLQWLTLRGAAAAMVVGLITFGLGGWVMVLILLSFFVSSVLISISDDHKKNKNVRRDGVQVWANGFWLCTWLVLGALTHQPVFAMMAVAALAVATGDTWATELGSRRFEVKTYHLLSRKVVPAGAQGGISVPGLAASLLGSAVIAVIFCVSFSIGMGWFLAIMISGFTGVLFDSYLGAGWQGRTYGVNGLQSGGQTTVCIDNNMVNWLATGFGSLLILIFKLIFL